MLSHLKPRTQVADSSLVPTLSANVESARADARMASDHVIVEDASCQALSWKINIVPPTRPAPL